MMKILHAYIFRGLLSNFIISTVIFLSVLIMGSMIKDAAEHLMQGVPLQDIGLLFLLLLPYFLSASIPMALLTSILLNFGRMSQDNEVIAIKSSGISIYQIAVPIWLFAIFLSLMTFKINNETIPYSHFAARKLMLEIGLKNPTAYLEPGNFVEIFPNHIIFIRDKKDALLKEVIIYQTVEEVNETTHQTIKKIKTITAKEGMIQYLPDKHLISLQLKDGNIQEPTDENPTEFYNLQFGSYTVNLDTSQLGQDPTAIQKKHKDMTIPELKAKIAEMQTKNATLAMISPLITEIHKKIAISFSCIIFTLIGIPLGIRAHRSEKTVGIGLSLLLVFFYYLFIIFGKALDDKPEFYPHLMMWIPNTILGIAGFFLMKKSAR